MTHVGEAIVKTLEAHGVKRAFLVPGESFLAVLDGLHDSPVDAIVCRHEGGASFAAEAHGKATGEAGVCMVTRGPGAANAKIGLYTAWQDETPMVLFVGLVPTADRYRESFQEFDVNAWFGDIAKGVYVVDAPERASRIVAAAFHLATSGRRGPVVVGLPEDIIAEEFTGTISGPHTRAAGAVSPSDLEAVASALRGAERPLIFEGGQGWTQDAADAWQRFAEEHQIPVLNDMRSSDKINFDSPANAGWLGTARNEKTAELLERADVLIQVGAKLWDKPTDNFELRQGMDCRNLVISVDPDQIANSGAITHHVLADPATFAKALDSLDLGGKPDTSEWFAEARRIHEDFSAIPPADARFPDLPEGAVDMYAVMEAIVDKLDARALCTYGAGNHCFWPQRFFPTRAFPSMLATRLGAMGYSVASAMAAKLADPERTVVAFTGDGELMMNGQELITAVRYETPMLVVVVDNEQYGTIRANQEKTYPGRVEGTQLVNPDFVMWAQSMGAWAEKIERNDEVAAAVSRAFEQVEAGQVALLHVIVDQDHATPEGSAEA
ncbi:thiamine pyrophosphate-binding protein [Corynebacterium sp. TA-R-1]|uniref:acetolactate synthase n=1 Tax=Corynebacterium stercoris TaxID=2943490 RepID=A0ABT1G0U8_9CORY|nr:thiamine pyrophosphate-dependent enzyme [Corynebacterium stercoris]MCP1387655.1 thiamine pyrophosphate-binding protein [Corynebacterium stercoris]